MAVENNTCVLTPESWRHAHPHISKRAVESQIERDLPRTGLCSGRFAAHCQTVEVALSMQDWA